MNSSLQLRPRIYGFFSSIFQMIDNLKYCELNNIKPIIKWDSISLYNNEEENCWGNFFEEINDGIPVGEFIDIYDLPGINERALFFLRDYMMVDPYVGNFRLKLWHFSGTMKSASNKEELYNYRVEINEMILKYIKPNEKVLNEVSKIINTEWDKTLAVHIRGTDYWTNQNTLDEFCVRIQDNIEKNKYEKIFVASDNNQSINYIKEKFKNVLYYNTDIRQNDLTSSAPICHNVSGEKKTKHGMDVLVECILLSKCDKIICVNSNVAAMACFLNPEMEFELISYQGPGG